MSDRRTINAETGLVAERLLVRIRISVLKCYERNGQQLNMLWKKSAACKTSERLLELNFRLPSVV